MSLANIKSLAVHYLKPRFDATLLFFLTVVVAAGMLALHSAANGQTSMLLSQGVRVAVGLFAMWFVSRLDRHQLRLLTPWLYLFSIFLLLLVPFLGSGRSARSWLNLGVFYVQPAELLKLTVPLAVASYLSQQSTPPRITHLLVAAGIIGLPAALIALQPDLGTAVIVAASGAFVVFLAGMRWWQIGACLAAAAAAAPLGWGFLKEYQRDRLRVFLDPESDPLGTGWNIIQSKIAVGSGGFWGKGLGQGTQARLDFLPEHTTDFIFAVFSEEFGLVGVLIVLTTYLLIVARALWLASGAPDGFSRMVAGALVLTFALYVVLNGGMVSGILPVVGVPMPLMSYGGTSAVTLLTGFGLIMGLTKPEPRTFGSK